MSGELVPPASSGGVIHLLSDEVIDRIAAGEVIERPASIVKELVENAIDAQANTIEVHLEDGGLSRIVVSDDGCGMSAVDAARAPLRHATSKLHSAEDLYSIATLGFRGEALSSIAAVSHFVLSTRRGDDAVGTRVRIAGGALARVEEAGVPVGTTMDVSDLFFNTPARKKFMRSSATEQAHACEAALRAVLGAGRASLVVTSGERRLVDLPAVDDIAVRARAALGPRAGALYAFDNHHEDVWVHGVTARPDVDRADAKGLWFFVNGRYVRDRMLQRAVLEGYRSMLGHGRYPSIMIYIDVPPAIVDVNVHPQKLEVRFSDSSLIYRAVSQALANALAKTPWLHPSGAVGNSDTVDRSYAWHANQRAASLPAAWQEGVRDAGPRAPMTLFTHRAGDTTIGQDGTLELPLARAGGYFGRMRALGQALGVYLVCAGNDEIVLIDQHAAHERVAYERLRASAARGSIPRQQLLFPEPLDLAPQHVAVLEEHWQALTAYGFEIEPIGPARFAVRAVPAALAAADAQRLAVDLVLEVCALEESGVGLQGREAENRIFSRCACHAAIRANDTIGSEEIAALLADLDRIDFGAACPHGRPVYHALARGELEHFFRRG